MMKPIIKSTSADDFPALVEVLTETKLFPGEMLSDMLAPFLAKATDAFWLSCHVQGAVVGFCYTVPEELAYGTWNMLALAVHPDLHAKGFGSALVSEAERYLRAKNQRILIVETSSAADFTLARKFYARNGYEEEARIRDFWAAGDDKVVFRKAL